ncbi:hypothetical protein MKX01_031298, partial [Papaver californicum]
MFLLNLNIYFPRDEKFSQLKFSDFLAYAVKGLGQVIRAQIKAIFDKAPNEFDTFDDVLHLYEGYQGLPKNSNLSNSCCGINLQLVKEIFHYDGAKPLKFPKPQVIRVGCLQRMDLLGTDEEFGREMLAGVNVLSICLLK